MSCSAVSLRARSIFGSTLGAAILLLSLAGSRPAEAQVQNLNTLNNYPTIQAAVSAASANDVSGGQVLVMPVPLERQVGTFENSLGMRFVPVPITGGPTKGQQVLFSFGQQFTPGSNESGALCAWSAWDEDLTDTNDTACVQLNVSVGMEAAQLVEMHLWPNPTNGTLHMDGLHSGMWHIRLFDAQGRAVLEDQRTTAHGPLELDLGAVALGTYVVQVSGESGQYRSRVTVQR